MRRPAQHRPRVDGDDGDALPHLVAERVDSSSRRSDVKPSRGSRWRSTRSFPRRTADDRPRARAADRPQAERRRRSSARRPSRASQRVRESQVSWLVEKSDYAPVFFNDPDTVVTSDGSPSDGADAPDSTARASRPQTHEGDVEFIESTRRGGAAGPARAHRTSLQMGAEPRDRLDRARYHPATGVLQFAAVWLIGGSCAYPGPWCAKGRSPASR